MLVLTRKKDERIVINDNIILTITEIVGSSKVVIGVDAPKSVKIAREELLDAEREKKTVGDAVLSVP